MKGMLARRMIYMMQSSQSRPILNVICTRATTISKPGPPSLSFLPALHISVSNSRPSTFSFRTHLLLPFTCSSAPFSSKDLVPCGRHDLVCTQASEWVSSGAQFCQLAGYDGDPDDVTPGGAPVCFDGKRIPPPGGREEGRRERKKDGSGFWDAAKKVRKKAEGELEGASGLGFAVLLTGAILLMW
jgi:hypothetical protein